MFLYVVKRILLGIPMLIGLSMILFLLLQLAPGDPAVYFLPADVTDPTQIDRVREQLGLTDSIPQQYVRWLGNVLQGDFGDAYSYGVPVTEVISARLTPTLQLQTISILFSLVVAIPLGIAAAVYKSTWVDRSLTTGSLFGLSMPDFWFGLLLISFFSLRLGWLPTSGNGGDGSILSRWEYFVMPVLVLGLATIPWYSRFMRSSLVQVRSEDYIRAARARGLSERRVLVRHSLKPAALPVLTIVALSLTRLIGGSVIVEVIFAWPGLGRLAYDSILRQDFPVVMALTLLVASSVIVINIVLDVTYTLVDPRISYGTVR
jgi:peptide/nickel transport system permease protein